MKIVFSLFTTFMLLQAGSFTVDIMPEENRTFMGIKILDQKKWFMIG